VLDRREGWRRGVTCRLRVLGKDGGYRNYDAAEKVAFLAEYFVLPVGKVDVESLSDSFWVRPTLPADWPRRVSTRVRVNEVVLCIDSL
jgi:hypothetical protein